MDVHDNPFERARQLSQKRVQGIIFPEEIQVIQFPQGKNIRSSYPFSYESSSHPALQELRETYKLDAVVAPGKRELEKFILLRNWVKSRWYHGWDHTRMKNPPKATDAREILREAENGRDFNCGFYAKTFLQCLISLGYQARLLGIGKDVSHIPVKVLHKETNIGHSVTEIWSNEYNKWIIMDADLNAYYEKDGIPLHAFEIRRAWLDKSWKEVDYIQDKEISTVCIKPDTYDAEVSRELAIFEQFNAMDYYHHISITCKNDYLSSSDKVLCLHWVDEDAPPSLIHSPGLPAENDTWTDNLNDLYWSLNQVVIKLESLVDGYSTLNFGLETDTPDFSHFLMQIDRGNWNVQGDIYSWKLQEGDNCIRVRVVNRLGIEGSISKMIVRYRN